MSIAEVWPAAFIIRCWVFLVRYSLLVPGRLAGPGSKARRGEPKKRLPGPKKSGMITTLRVSKKPRAVRILHLRRAGKKKIANISTAVSIPRHASPHTNAGPPAWDRDLVHSPSKIKP